MDETTYNQRYRELAERRFRHQKDRVVASLRQTLKEVERVEPRFHDATVRRVEQSQPFSSATRDIASAIGNSMLMADLGSLVMAAGEADHALLLARADEKEETPDSSSD
jgi:hypothetical protein